MNRRRESRPDKAPATVAVQDTEQESTIYQFLKKSREDSATDFVKFDFIKPSQTIFDKHLCHYRDETLQIYIKTYVYGKGCYIKQCFINLIHLNEFIHNFVHLYFPSCTIQGLVKTEMDFV